MKINLKMGVPVILAFALGWVFITPRLIPPTIFSDATAPHQGFLSPEFELEMLDGENGALQDFSGKVVLLNFWASWCPPCRSEMPAVQRVYETYQADGFEVVAVNMAHQDSLPDVQSFLDVYGLTFPVLLDQTGETAAKYQVRALPTTFLIDRQGVIREVLIGGPLSEAFLTAKVEGLLEEVD